jgi:opacity protein-like surface antigen|tara:strand:- start:155 stop:580 length:426 start_codon:yes stop_codon:yes gene_type:complete
MKKLFLTSAIALSTLFASAQNFLVVTTYDGDQEETVDQVTQNIGFGYAINDTWTLGLIQNGEDVDGETIYDVWARYNLKNDLYVSLQAPQEETVDNLTVGLGYSFNVWKGLNVEPRYSMGLKEDEAGEREGTFNLGFSYRF